jgi:hypothetical protein
MDNLSLSIILPIKSSVVKDFEDFFKKAIDSIKNNEVKPKELIIVHTIEEQLTSFLDSFDFGDLEVKKVPYSKTPNYGDQIN